MDAVELLNEGRAEDAVRLSAEKLAHADEALRQVLNTTTIIPDDAAHRSAVNERVAQFAEALLEHGNILLAIDPDVTAPEVFSVALFGLMLLDLAASQGAEAEKEHLKVAVLAMVAFSRVAQTLQQDEFTMQHVPEIFRLLCNVINGYMKDVPRPETSPEAAEEYEGTMDSARNIIAGFAPYFQCEYPQVTLADGRQVAYSSSDIAGDIIGRSRALGILTAD